jgi:5-methylthioadenosine/S-adenosylhomocysteine deaminase
MKNLLVALIITLLMNTGAQSAAQNRRSSRESVDLLVLGGTIVTMNNARDVIEDGGLAVRGGRIVAIGPRAQIESTYTARQRINAAGKLITPGLINGHTHIPMVLFRGLADDLDLESSTNEVPSTRQKLRAPSASTRLH